MSYYRIEHHDVQCDMNTGNIIFSLPRPNPSLSNLSIPENCQNVPMPFTSPNTSSHPPHSIPPVHQPTKNNIPEITINTTYILKPQNDTIDLSVGDPMKPLLSNTTENNVQDESENTNACCKCTCY